MGHAAYSEYIILIKVFILLDHFIEQLQSAVLRVEQKIRNKNTENAEQRITSWTTTETFTVSVKGD